MSGTENVMNGAAPAAPAPAPMLPPAPLTASPPPVAPASAAAEPGVGFLCPGEQQQPQGDSGVAAMAAGDTALAASSASTPRGTAASRAVSPGGTKRMKTDDAKEEKPLEQLPPFVVTLPMGFPNADPGTALSYNGIAQFAEHLSNLLDTRFTLIQDRVELLGQHVEDAL